MAFKFLHAADIHLDSRLRGLRPYDEAPTEKLGNPTRKALQNLVGLAIEEKVSFVVIAGDLYDGDWKSYDTGLFFLGQMARLRDAAIRVFLVRGNHDAESVITKGLTMPENVEWFATAAPETKVIDDPGVALHGQSFAKRDVTEDLSAAYPPPTAGLFNIGVLHTAAQGREGHELYAPCDPAALAAKGYDYWALGHVHEREVISADPPIVFPGNLQGRHVNEAAPEGKGCTLVHVDDAGRAQPEHRAVDTVRWARLVVDATGAADLDAVVGHVRDALAEAVQRADGRLLAARVRVEGATDAHRALVLDPERLVAEIRAAALDLSAESIWLEKVEVASRPTTDLAALRQRDDQLGSLVRILDAVAEDADSVAALIEATKPLLDKLPSDLLDQDAWLRELREGGGFAALVDAARDLLVARLGETGEGE